MSKIYFLIWYRQKKESACTSPVP